MSTPLPPAAAPGIRCQWSNTIQGQCTEEVDFAISYDYPPCGCHDNIDNTYQFCIRHLLRAMHAMMGKIRCPNCGKEYRGLQRLRRIERL